MTPPADLPNAPWQYGVSLYSYNNEYGVTMTLDDCVEDVADLGATGLEILGETHIADYPHPSATWIDAWFARLEKFALTPTCYGSWVDTRRFGARPITVDEAIWHLETDIRLAATLGFSMLRPKLGVVTDDLEPDPVWEPAALAVLDLAAEKNIVICPEIHWPTVIKSKVVDDFLALIERTGSPHFRLLLDTGVFQRKPHWGSSFVSSRLGDGSARPPEVPVVPVADAEAILPYVVHVQAKFYEVDDNLVDQEIPWAPFLGLLTQYSWAGSLSSEYEGAHGVGRAADQLRRQHALLRTLSTERR